MTDTARILEAVTAMRNSKVDHYAIPGLTSHLVGGNLYGRVRLFEAKRYSYEFIAPHSHRFDFTCLVLKGRVNNMLFTEATHGEFPNTDKFATGTLTRSQTEGMGDYDHFEPGNHGTWYTATRNTYNEGDVYSMTRRQIHSIEFARDTQVLFFEGPETVMLSKVLEPWVDGERVPTFEVRPWMFKR